MRAAKPRGYWDDEHPMAPKPMVADVTVYEPADLTIHTGLLDAAGHPITYQIRQIGPIGFIDFDAWRDANESQS